MKGYGWESMRLVERLPGDSFKIKLAPWTTSDVSDACIRSPNIGRFRSRKSLPEASGRVPRRSIPGSRRDQPAATICRNDAGYELKEAQIRPTWQSYRVLTGQEPHKHFGLARVDLEKPCPTIQKGQPTGTTGGLIHPWDTRHLTISEIRLMSSFPAGFRLEGSFHDKWARIGNSVPPLLGARGLTTTIL